MEMKLFLLRYDTERDSAEEMKGFFEQAIAIHRRERIPATFFCKGGSIEAREGDFRAFWQEVRGDPLFDIQDHSYTHIGLGYERGKDIATLRADYERSFAAHERVFGVRPVGVSICGTGGKDGARLQGFDQTDKARAEFEMMAGLGLRMINSLLVGVDESRQFINYGRLGHPEIMGFPSSYSDTSWMRRKEYGDPLAYILSVIEERAQRDEHMPLMLHDWVAWNHAPDKALGHVQRIVERARALGYEMVTHVECLRNRSELWQKVQP
jgi:peptidoglycan/xylan/chitin deacetylase (PgdA/CDA1 family)